MPKGKSGTARPPAPAMRAGISRRAFLIGAAVVAAGGMLAWTLADSTERERPLTVTVWQHACCAEWVSYLQRNGYRVMVNHVDDMAGMKAELGIPDPVQSCHTAMIADYIVEGHVPAAAIARLLDERPALVGIALPGMPAGPPGMGGSSGIYRVVGFTADGRTRGFAKVRL